MALPIAGTRPGVLFHLRPVNSLSRSLVYDRENKHLQAYNGADVVVEIGHIKSRQGPTTLASVGRGDVDVVLDNEHISRVQCSFEIDPETGVIMFVDRSSGGTCHFTGKEKCNFLKDAPRRVVVHPGVNTHVKLGRMHAVEFYLVWRYDHAKDVLAAAKRLVAHEQRLKPRHRRDAGGDVTAKPYRPASLTPSPWTARFKWTGIDRLGSGAFGTVWKGLNHHTGEIMAVKQLKKPDCPRNTDWQTVQKEVDVLSQLRHPNIVEFIGSSGWDTGNVEIFMDLKHGSLGSLMKRASTTLLGDLTNSILRQMLEALDFLDHSGIVHRDLKPDNILYTDNDGSYRFYLGDFGISNYEDISKSSVGTTLFMAPECWERTSPKTHKVDVWALYVSILYMLNIDDFYNRCRRCPSNRIVDLVLGIAEKHRTPVSSLYQMAAAKPKYRFTAQQALEKYFNIRVDHSRHRRARPGPGPGVAPARRPEQRNNHLSPDQGFDRMISQFGRLELAGGDRRRP